MDGWMDGWMDWRTDGQIDRWVRQCQYIYLPILLNLPGGLQVGTNFAIICSYEFREILLFVV